MKKLLAAATALAMLGAPGAHAALLDFTDASVLTGQPGSPVTVTVGGVDVTITAAPDALNFNDGLADGTAAFCQAGGGAFACDQDGLGIRDDEVSPGETLTLAFGQAVNIASLSFLDLFIDPDGQQDETVMVMVNGAAATTLDALIEYSSGANGFATFDGLDLGAVTTLTFLTGTGNDGIGVADFAVAGLDFAPVPVPAAGLLFAGALAGGTAARRRQAT